MRDRAARLTNDAGTSVRARVREIIRDEVARSNPIEDARGPLELIVETSIRYSETNGETRIEVVGADGQPRTTIKDGVVSDFTLSDLVRELREQRPTLFKPTAGKSDEPPAGETDSMIAMPTAAAREQSPPEEDDLQDNGASRGLRRAERDWLDISSTEREESRRRRSFGSDIGLRFGTAAGRLRSGLSRFPRFRAGGATAKLRAVRSSVIGALGRTLATLRAGAQVLVRFAQGRRSIGLATLAGGCLLVVIGALLLAPPRPASDRAADSAPSSVAEPATTGGVAAPESAVAAPETGQPVQTGALRGVPEVLDTSTLQLEGKVVRLFGVEWARGGSPEDLVRYLRGREVVCRQASSAETYRCDVGGQDLSKVVLFNGGGRATAEATPELKVAEEKARSARIGVWSK
jgi:hypothetical protein